MFLFVLLNFFFPKFNLTFFSQNLYLFIEFLHCLHYFIHLFICVPFEHIQIFIYVFFNFVGHYIITILNCLSGIFSISLSLMPNILELFTHIWVFLSCFFFFLVFLHWNFCNWAKSSVGGFNLLYFIIEIFTLYRQDWVVGILKFSFLPLN
jgi:hypothetical protein